MDGDTPSAVYADALAYCVARRAMLIVDPPAAWSANPATAASTAAAGLGALGLAGTDARNAALYFPRIIEADPTPESQLQTFVPVGHGGGGHGPDRRASAGSGRRRPGSTRRWSGSQAST